MAARLLGVRGEILNQTSGIETPEVWACYGTAKAVP